MTHSSPVTTVASPETPATDKRKFEYDSIAVLISGAVTAVLGLVFWAVTARMYPVDVVGRASAVINSAVVLSTLSTLSSDRCTSDSYLWQEAVPAHWSRADISS